MPRTRMIRINNWSSFQSYKDRNPPWIRLHKKILDNYEFHSMSAEARAILPMLWLLASEDENPVSGMIRKSYEQITFRLRMDINDLVNAVDECEQKGFVTVIIERAKTENTDKIHDCSVTVTDKLQECYESVTPETETETEKPMCNSVELHVPSTRAKHRKRIGYTADFISFWNEYPRSIGKHEALKAFLRVTKEYPSSDVISAAKEYSLQCGKDNTPKKFIKHPRTFLNEDRWKDYCFEEESSAK